MTKYIIGEFFSSSGATLFKNPSDQTVLLDLNHGPIIDAHQNYVLDVQSERINNSNYEDFAIALISIRDLKSMAKLILKPKSNISLDNLEI